MKNKSVGKFEKTLFVFLTLAAISAIFNQTVAAQHKIKTVNSKIVNSKTVVSNKNVAAAVSPAGKNPDDFAADEAEILRLVNAERNARGLVRLAWDDAVANIAREYSKRMAGENFFGHFDADGKNVVERAKAARLKHWSKIGENLFSIENLVRFDAFAVKNWMQSPTHRDNILALDWTTTGIGIAKSSSGEIFITQIFIKR